MGIVGSLPMPTPAEAVFYLRHFDPANSGGCGCARVELQSASLNPPPQIAMHVTPEQWRSALHALNASAGKIIPPGYVWVLLCSMLVLSMIGSFGIILFFLLLLPCMMLSCCHYPKHDQDMYDTCNQITQQFGGRVYFMYEIYNKHGHHIPAGTQGGHFRCIRIGSGSPGRMGALHGALQQHIEMARLGMGPSVAMAAAAQPPMAVATMASAPAPTTTVVEVGVPPGGKAGDTLNVGYQVDGANMTVAVQVPPGALPGTTFRVSVQTAAPPPPPVPAAGGGVIEVVATPVNPGLLGPAGESDDDDRDDAAAYDNGLPAAYNSGYSR